MEFRILGSLEVSAHGAPLSVGGPSEQKVLAVLLLSDESAVIPLDAPVQRRKVLGA